MRAKRALLLFDLFNFAASITSTFNIDVFRILISPSAKMISFD
jgi:hypothetical protein